MNSLHPRVSDIKRQRPCSSCRPLCGRWGRPSHGLHESEPRAPADARRRFPFQNAPAARCRNRAPHFQLVQHSSNDRIEPCARRTSAKGDTHLGIMIRSEIDRKIQRTGISRVSNVEQIAFAVERCEATPATTRQTKCLPEHGQPGSIPSRNLPHTRRVARGFGSIQGGQPFREMPAAPNSRESPTPGEGLERFPPPGLAGTRNCRYRYYRDPVVLPRYLFAARGGGAGPNFSESTISRSFFRSLSATSESDVNISEA